MWRIGKSSDSAGPLNRALEAPYGCETARVRKDGREIQVSVTISPIVDSLGKVVGASKIARDITERKQAEEASRRNQAQLAEAQTIAHLGSWEWDIVSNLVTWSDELYRIYGLEPQQFVATYQGFLDRIHPDDREPFKQNIERAFGDGRPFSFEHRIVRPDGAVRRLHARGCLLVNQEGKPVRMTGTGEDITERMDLQEQLVFSARMASVGTLAAGVAHEINNPLTYVLSNIDVAMQEIPALIERLNKLEALFAQAIGSTSGASRDFSAQEVAAGLVRDLAGLAESLGEAREGAHRVKHIVRDLKTFSRAEDHKRGPIQVRHLLESSINMAWNEIRHRARLKKDFGDVAPVEGNESRLGQVFLNLLINAAQSMPEGNADRNEILVVTRMDPSGQVAIEFHDTGSGISPDIIGRVFDPFFTTKAIGVGTGLGLSICQNIVKDLGGQISVESKVGRGTTFRVVLPPARLEAREQKPAPSPTRSGRRGRILLLDDEAMVLLALRRILGPEHEIVSLTLAREALGRLAAGERFDVMLCDLMMPEMTGMDLHEELMRLAPDQASKMVFMTGGAFTPRAREFLDRVPNQRIEKPFEVQNLRALIQSLLPES